jgi:glutamyl-tRNA synthetase
LDEDAESRLIKGMAGLKERAKTLPELAESAEIYAMTRPLRLNEKADQLVQGVGRDHLDSLRGRLTDVCDWNHEALENAVRAYADSADIKLGKAAQPLRAALTGRTVSPSIFEVIEILGRDEVLGRLDDVLKDL